MSGLDDSLSDVGGKKKYPFELEKAIHNVMFIQHHMQRQDEFNAVSVSWKLHVHSSCFQQNLKREHLSLIYFSNFLIKITREELSLILFCTLVMVMRLYLIWGSYVLHATWERSMAPTENGLGIIAIKNEMQNSNENCNKFSFSSPFNLECCVERCFAMEESL